MWRHFKHLCFKTFLMVSWGPIWCLFAFPTKALNIRNFHTNATPKVGVHLGIIELHPLHSPSFVKVCFTPKQILGLMGPRTSHLITKPMLGLQHFGISNHQKWYETHNIGLYLMTNIPNPVHTWIGSKLIN
jgi:hypothetical protein